MKAVPRPLEAEVQRACVALLESRGVFLWRNNSRVMKVPGKGGRDRLMRMGGGKGSPDLMGLLPGGRFIAVEVKRPGERPRPDQYDWLDRVRSAGGVACWASDAATLDAVLARVLGSGGGRVSVEIDRETGEQFFVEA
jgi:hypothetical protein